MDRPSKAGACPAGKAWAVVGMALGSSRGGWRSQTVADVGPEHRELGQDPRQVGTGPT